jgi:NADP-dependent 3-hydroxy acid dehydrogenase YdfG
MNTLAGRTIALTGAASGIGRALAHATWAQGARLCLADWDSDGLDRVRLELDPESARPRDLHCRSLDISDRRAIFEWAAECATKMGPVHVLINNAGVNLHVPLEEMDPNDLSWLFGVNFFGVFHGVQAFLPHLIASGDGHIVNLSSVFGLVAAPGSAAYVASKFAVRGLSEALEIELALARHPVRVTCAHPGGVSTGIVRNGRTRGEGPLSRSHDAVSEAFDKHLARLTPDECAEAIVQAIVRRNTRLLVGLDAHFLDLLQRTLPRMYRRLLIWALDRTRVRSIRQSSRL